MHLLITHACQIYSLHVVSGRDTINPAQQLQLPLEGVAGHHLHEPPVDACVISLDSINVVPYQATSTGDCGNRRAKMARRLFEKCPLKTATTPMTSSSSCQPSVSRSDIAFTLEQKKSKGMRSKQQCQFECMLTKCEVTTFHPLLTPSPLLEPKVLERKQKALTQR
jgi:hypothetical protein